MPAFLITGAAGFIGSNLARALVDKGSSVIGVDCFLAGKRENLTGIGEGFRFVEGDIRDPALLPPLCAGVDFVLHHAAMASVPWSVAQPALAHAHNVTGTFNVLAAAREAGVRRVVMASTSAVYGNRDLLPSREDQPLDPLSPYAVTKLMGEHYLAMFSRVWGLPTVGLRYFNVFGPRQDPTSAYAAAIPIFTRALLRGERPVIFGDGEQTRDFVFVEDVIRANLLACEAGPGVDGRVFNIGTGTRITVNRLCGLLGSLLGAGQEPVHGPARDGDALHSMADISRAREALGFEPAFDVGAGLERAIGWYKENLK